MAKTSTKIIAGVIALAGAYFIYKYFKPSKKDKNNSGGTPTPKDILDVTPTPKPTSNYPLRKGDKGSLVKGLQQLMLKLDSKILPKYGADGDFGSETEAAAQKLLGKKFVEKADIDKLNEMYNKRILVYQSNVNTQQPLPPFFGGVK